ncbi:glycine zipper family protein [Paenirhodobacter populi]|uniref:Glycine zipper family protein n=1 Tax=Paenirhodobacter populi TaxID=2306993 RepID=A0A443IPS1_9RHOB|nr:glycine zipper family protein [Sinirhodobacter populi]RWR08521.1 glycine zipper family protein [Sinirhodobacter populi]RWR28846.1 glycine zipper family protein [Sinirhodobacter populi]
MKRIATLSLICATFLAACQPVQPLSEYRPAVDPAKVKPAKYESDLAECRNVALQVEADYKERQGKEAAQNLVAGLVVGALLGAAVGSHASNQGDLIGVGAATGALAGAGSGDYTHDLVTYGPRRVVDRCMDGRGYKLLTDFGRA